MANGAQQVHGHARPTTTSNEHLATSSRLSGSADVVMIDDDVSARETFGLILAHAGYDFVATETGGEGIQLAQACQPEVAIVDLRLPDLSGIDVISAIRNSSPRTVSVLLTGFWDIKAEFEAKSAGAWACLDKPVFGDELLEVVSRASIVRAGHPALAELNVVQVWAIESHASARLVERLTMFIGASIDEPTLRGFGHAIGVSRGALRNWCKTAALKPRSVRDFGRGLRAAWHFEHDPSFQLAELLDIVDERTLRAFCLNSGGTSHRFPSTVDEFLKHQLFIKNPEFVTRVFTSLGSTTFESAVLKRR